MARNRFIRADSIETFQAIQILSDPGRIPGKTQVPQAAQVTIHWGTDAGTEAVCVLYGRYVGAFDTIQADVDAAKAALVAGSTWTNLAAFMGTTTAITAVGVRDVNTVDRPIIMSSTAAVPGSSVSSALPAEVAVCVTLNTAAAGHSGRGRFYVPNWATNALATANQIASAATTALVLWARQNVPAMMAALTFTHCLGLLARAAYTGSTGTQHPARPAQTIDVTSYDIRDSFWDSQRRRGLG